MALALRDYLDYLERLDQRRYEMKDFDFEEHEWADNSLWYKLEDTTTGIFPGDVIGDRYQSDLTLNHVEENFSNIAEVADKIELVVLNTTVAKNNDKFRRIKFWHDGDKEKFDLLCQRTTKAQYYGDRSREAVKVPGHSKYGHRFLEFLDEKYESDMDGSRGHYTKMLLVYDHFIGEFHKEFIKFGKLIETQRFKDGNWTPNLKSIIASNGEVQKQPIKHVFHTADEFAQGVLYLCYMMSHFLNGTVLSVSKVQNPNLAYSVFLNMNSKGTPLTCFEIVRAQIIGMPFSQDESTELAEYFSQIKGNLVKDPKKDLSVEDDFLRHYWISRTGIKSSKTGIMRQITNYLAEHPSFDSTRTLMSDLTQHSTYYAQITGKAKTDDICLNGRLDDFNSASSMKQHLPMLLKSWANYDQESERTKFLDFCIFTYLRWNCLGTMSPSGVESFFAETCGLINGDDVDTDFGAIISHAQTYPLLQSYSNEDFVEQFKEACTREEKPVFGYKTPATRDNTRLVIRLLEAWKLENTELVMGGNNSVHLEHILPQSPEGNYWEEKFSSDERTHLTDRLGNLILLASKLNIAGSNNGFDIKVKQYEQSSLFFPRELANTYAYFPIIKLFYKIFSI